MKNSKILRERFEKGDLTAENLEQILCDETSVKRKSFKISKEILNRFFSECQSNEEVETRLVYAVPRKSFLRLGADYEAKTKPTKPNPTSMQISNA